MKNTRFMLVQAVCGAFVGLAVAVILAAIAVPRFSDLFVPLEMARDFEQLAGLAHFLSRSQWLWLVLALLALCLSWVLTARRLNPALPQFPFRAASLPGIVWTSFILSGFCILGGFLVMFGEIQDMTGLSPDEAKSLPVLALGLFLIILGWLFISPEGCSGSFGERSRRLMPRVLGVLTFLALLFGSLFAFLELNKNTGEPGPMILGAVLLWAVLAAPIYWISMRLRRFLENRWGNAVVDVSETPPQYIRTAALGLLFGVILALGIFVCQRLWMFLFALNVEVWTDSIEVTFGGMIRIMGILIFVCAALFSIGFGLAQAFSADGSSVKERLRRAVPAAFLAAVLAIPIGFLYLNAILKHDWRSGGLAKATGLSKEIPEPMTVITLGLFLGKKSVELTPWPMTAEAYSLFSSAGEVSATEENAKRLEAFLEEKKESRYRTSAFDAFPRIYTVLWENEKGMQAQDRFMFSEGFSRELPLLWYALRLSNLVNSSPITKENKERLLRLSDSSRFQIKGNKALSLAKGWRRAGDFSRARFWFEEAKRLGADSQDIQKFGSLSEKPLTSGVIRGRIRIQKASSPARIKVGLFSLRVVPLRATDSISPPYHGNIFLNLVESQWARPDGSFLFKNLSSEGGYYICLLVPSSLIQAGEKNKVRVAGHPGLIRLSKISPAKDLGAIAIRLPR